MTPVEEIIRTPRCGLISADSAIDSCIRNEPCREPLPGVGIAVSRIKRGRHHGAVTPGHGERVKRFVTQTCDHVREMPLPACKLKQARCRKRTPANSGSSASPHLTEKN